MKLLLTKLALFLSIALAIAIVLQLTVSIRVKDYNIAGSQTLHYENVNADLIFLGSSRAWAHFDPKFFEKTFGLKSVNVAVTGHSEIELATLRLNNYLSKNRAPKYAIFNFDPMASADSVNNAGNFVLKNAFVRYAFWPDKRDEPFLDFFKFDAAEKNIPAYALLKYSGLPSHLFPETSNYYTQFGYERNDEVWDTVKHPVTDVMKKHYFRDTEIHAIAQAVKKLNALCLKHNIKLLCIQTPVYKSIYDAHYFSRNKAICAQLGIRYIDMESPDFRNNVEYFYNSNHMNLKGVEKMNALLVENAEVRSLFGASAKTLKSVSLSKSKSKCHKCHCSS